jgi:ribosomal protein S12 methylthiotransferase accessory factor
MSERSILLVGTSAFARRVEQLVQRYGQIPLQHTPAMPPALAPDAHALIVDASSVPPVPSSAGDRLPRLSLGTLMGLGMVGPLHMPGSSGCARCALHRFLTVLGAPLRTSAVTEHVQRQRAHRSSDDGHIHAWSLLAEYAVDVIERFCLHGHTDLERAAFVLDLETMTSRLHRFVPDPRCPVCGYLPEDRPEAARIAIEPRPKRRRTEFRVRDLDAQHSGLEAAYVDPRFGMISRIVEDVSSPFPLTWSRLPLEHGGEEFGVGRAFTYRDSRTVGLLEALERYAGMMPRGKRTVVRGCLRELGARAIDPRRLGLQLDEAYASSAGRLTPFDDDLVLDWVWAYSFLRREPVLVPEQVAYYGIHVNGSPDPRIVVEISNGCALGSSREEAILYGMLEVIERDGFLVTWYRQLAVPEIEIHSIDDRKTLTMLRRIEQRTGCRIRLFNITMEHGIPNVWAIATEGAGEQMIAHCAAGAHLDPLRAIRSALHELAAAIVSLRARYREREQAVRALATDPMRVRHMEEHALLFCVPGVARELGFVLDGAQPGQHLHDAFPHAPVPCDGLGDDLKALLARFLGRGQDVLVVDQTPADLTGGYSCVKVLIPGMLPMTFGHHLRRCRDLPRLCTVPEQLGYRTAAAQLNPFPHPFP